MTNWFASIGQAGSGLNAARYNLTVVSQNIANASTPGYKRETVTQAAVDGFATPSISTGRVGTTGGGLNGVAVASTDRVDDPVLDARVRAEHASGAAADTTASTLSAVEQIVPEPDTGGLSDQLGNFWKAWGSVANDPAGTSGSRAILLQSAGTVAHTLNGLSSSLAGVTQDTATSLGNDLAGANTAASQLGSLNDKIAVASATGQNPSSLLDQRDQLLDTLSTTVGASVRLNANGTADVTVGGQSLVSGDTVTTLSADASTHQVSVGGTAVSLDGGNAAARVTALTVTIPGYQSRLDGVANALSSATNSIQAAGYDLSGNAGTAMFTGAGAAGISVALTDPNAIAASSTPGGNLGNGNALTASQHGTAADGPDAAYTGLVGDVGSASAAAQQQQTTQDSVVANVDSLQQSTSGVSYDEEVSQMMIYQNAFSASSRVLTTVDQMLDTLINHTGMVGMA